MTIGETPTIPIPICPSTRTFQIGLAILGVGLVGLVRVEHRIAAVQCRIEVDAVSTLAVVQYGSPEIRLRVMTQLAALIACQASASSA